MKKFLLILTLTLISHSKEVKKTLKKTTTKNNNTRQNKSCVKKNQNSKVIKKFLKQNKNNMGDISLEEKIDFKHSLPYEYLRTFEEEYMISIKKDSSGTFFELDPDGLYLYKEKKHKDGMLYLKRDKFTNIVFFKSFYKNLYVSAKHMCIAVIFDNKTKSVHTVLTDILFLYKKTNNKKILTLITWFIQNYYHNLKLKSPKHKSEINQAEKQAVNKVKEYIHENKSTICIDLDEKLPSEIFAAEGCLELEPPDNKIIINKDKNGSFSCVLNTKIAHKKADGRSIIPVQGGFSESGGIIFQSNYRDVRFFDIYCDINTSLYYKVPILYMIYKNNYRMSGFLLSENKLFCTRHSSDIKYIELWYTKLTFPQKNMTSMLHLSNVFNQTKYIYNYFNSNIYQSSIKINDSRYLSYHTLIKTFKAKSFFTVNCIPFIRKGEEVEVLYKDYHCNNKSNKSNKSIYSSSYKNQEKILNHIEGEDIVDCILDDKGNVMAVKSYNQIYKWTSYSENTKFLTEIQAVIPNIVDITVLSDSIYDQDILLKIDFSDDLPKYYIYNIKKKTLSEKHRKKSVLDYYRKNLAVIKNIKYEYEEDKYINANITIPKKCFSKEYKSGFSEIQDEQGTYYVKKNTPAVVLIHGAMSYGRPVFNLQKIYFTNKGFVVIEPNYRWSENQSKEILYSGLGRWGEIYHDIEKASKWARNIFASKVIVCGGSFGGYLSITSILKSPELFDLCIAACPVTNVKTLIQEIPGFLEVKIYDVLTVLKIDLKSVKNLEIEKIILKNQYYLESISPYYFIKESLNYYKENNLHRKIMIVHGDLDSIVTPSHTNQISEYNSENISIEIHFIKGEEHNLNTEVESVIEVLYKINRFIDDNIDLNKLNINKPSSI